MHRCSPHTYVSHVILPTSSILLHIFVPPFHAVHPKAIAHPLLPVSVINCPSLLPHLCTLSCIHSKISVFIQLPLYIQLSWSQADIVILLTMLFIVGPFPSVDVSIDSIDRRPDSFFLGTFIPVLPKRLPLLWSFVDGHAVSRPWWLTRCYGN